MTIIRAFHASTSKDISSFGKFSHFETREAACYRGTLIGVHAGQPTWLHQVKLWAAAPLDVYDMDGTAASADHSTQSMATLVRNAGIKVPFMTSGIDAKPEQIDAEWDAIAMALTGAGFDAIRYVNGSEDPGSTSICIPDPRRIANIGRPEPILFVWYPSFAWVSKIDDRLGDAPVVMITPYFATPAAMDSLRDLGSSSLPLGAARTASPLADWAIRLARAAGTNVDVVIASGGGMHKPELADRLKVDLEKDVVGIDEVMLPENYGLNFAMVQDPSDLEAFAGSIAAFHEKAFTPTM